MKNKLILSLVALFFAFGLNAQVNLQEKRIYVVDVTASMEGRGVISTPDIFSTVKNNLEKTISNISDLSTEVEIITFTNKVLSEYSNTVANKEDIISYVQSLKVCGGDTNIADAWSAGVSKLDPNKINYLFLLTDGLHNCGPDKNVLYERLSDWANFSEGKYMFAFYVMLTPNAHELAICQTVEETQNMWLIESMDIDASLVKVSSVISANVFENNLVNVEIEPNEPINLDEIGFRLDVEKNDYYDVSVYRIDSTKITLAVSEKVDRMSIPLCDTISLGLTHNTSDYPFVFFTPEQLSFIVANQGKRTVKIKEDSFLAFPITEIKIKSKFKEPFRGPFKWGRRIFEPTLDYYPFKWFAPDTTVNTYPVKLDFNDEAIRSSAQISLSFRDENNGILPICSLSSKSTFNALSDNGKQVLEISVDPTIKGGKYTGNIFVSASDIDEVNGEISSSGLYKIGKLTIKEKHPWPLLLWFLWIVLTTIVLGAAWFLIRLIIVAVTCLIYGASNVPVSLFGLGGISGLFLPWDKLLNDFSSLTADKQIRLIEKIQAKIDALQRKNQDEADRYFNSLPQNVQDALEKYNKSWRLPKNGGTWTGERGDSVFKPDASGIPVNSNPERKTWRQILKEYKCGEGIRYRKCKVDFSPITYDKVELPGTMAGDFDRYSTASGAEALHDRANVMIAKKWGVSVEKAREKIDNLDLCWHEDVDCKTIRLVPRIIHDNMPHTGGRYIAQCFL